MLFYFIQNLILYYKRKNYKSKMRFLILAYPEPKGRFTTLSFLPQFWVLGRVSSRYSDHIAPPHHHH